MKKFWFLAAISILLISCGKDSQGGDEGKETKEVQCNLKGYAQKGQFVKGSQVTAFAVGADMVEVLRGLGDHRRQIGNRGCRFTKH